MVWLCVIAIVISIFLGWKFNRNTGVFAMVFAFLIGYFGLGMGVNAVIGYFPVAIVFYLIIVSLFFNYATNNGTMEVLGKKMLYALGGNARLVPWAAFIISAVVALLGAGSSTPLIVGPFIFVVGCSAGVDPTLTAVAITLGNLLGGASPFNGYGGIIGKNLIIANGETEEYAMNVALKLFYLEIIVCIVLMVVFYFLLKGYKGKKVHVEKPEDYNKTQKITLTIVLLVFAFMLVPPMLNLIIKNNAFITKLAGICQPQVVMAIGAVACSLLKLGDEKQAIRSIPVNTIVMITGVYMLVKVAAAAGMVDMVSKALQNSIPRGIVLGAIVLFAAFLSFFSSSTSTVMPLLYPLVPGLAASLSLNPVALYFCCFWGGFTTACSPFSTGGSVLIAANPYNEEKEKLSKTLIIMALVMPVISIILAEVGLFNIFSV